MDESGDLGFTRQLDKDYFVMAVLQTTTPTLVGNCLSRARSRVLKKKRRHVSELKASASDQRVRPARCPPVELGRAAEDVSP